VYNPPSFSRVVELSAETCLNLSLFKDLMREYRKLDDSVTMRLNRSNAQFRDRQRSGSRGAASSNPQDEACLSMWRQLVGNWKARAGIIQRCTEVVDEVMVDRRKGIEGTEASLDAEPAVRAQLYSDEVLRNQIRNEHMVESIVRQRSLDAFTSRCRFFEPPLNDAEGREWWNSSQRRR